MNLFIRKKRYKRKTEFSKLILIIDFTFTIIVVSFAMALMWVTQTTDALEWLIAAVFGAYGVSTGFYFWKARRENEIKLRKQYGDELMDQVNEVIKDESEEN